MLFPLVASIVLAGSLEAKMEVAAELQRPFQVMAGSVALYHNIGHLAPNMADMNGDGKLDLLVGRFEGGQVALYPNIGTAERPRFGKPTDLNADGKPMKAEAG